MHLLLFLFNLWMLNIFQDFFMPFILLCRAVGTTKHTCLTLLQ